MRWRGPRSQRLLSAPVPSAGVGGVHGDAQKKAEEILLFEELPCFGLNCIPPPSRCRQVRRIPPESDDNNKNNRKRNNTWKCDTWSQCTSSRRWVKQLALCCFGLYAKARTKSRQENGGTCIKCMQIHKTASKNYLNFYDTEKKYSQLHFISKTPRRDLNRGC